MNDIGSGTAVKSSLPSVCAILACNYSWKEFFDGALHPIPETGERSEEEN
jgi:hypothetical protein